MGIKARTDKEAQALYARLFALVRKDFEITPDGRLSAEALISGEVYALFPLCFKPNDLVPEHRKYGAISAGIKSILTSEATLPQFVDSANSYLRTGGRLNTKSFMMWSDLNLIWDAGALWSLTIEGTRVYCGPKLPSNFPTFPTEKFDRNSMFRRNEERSCIWGHANASDILEAGRKINRALDLFQALVNIQRHLHNKVSIFQFDLRPTSVLDHGPNYYIFDKQTKKWSNTYLVADENFEKLWSDADRKASKFRKLLPVLKRHSLAIDRSPFRDRLRDALLHLNASWKASTKARRGRSLWLALEGLFADKGAHCDQQTIIRRALHGLTGSTRQIAKDRLRYLAELRNSEVHNYSYFSDTDRSHVVLQACNLLVVDCYRSVLNLNTKIIRNESDFIRFVDLSGDLRDLANRKRVIEYALKILDR